VKGILADVNIQGHVDQLIAAMQSETWKPFWDVMDLQYQHFSDLGLAHDSLDSAVWETCQQNELVLVTDNRNEDASDSLETTIRSRNTATSLPVITIANIPRLRQAGNMPTGSSTSYSTFSCE